MNRFAKWIVGFCLILPLNGDSRASSPGTSESTAAPLSAETLKPDDVVNDYSRFLRPQTAEELAATARQLSSLGMQQQAERLLNEAQQAWLQEQRDKLAEQESQEPGDGANERLITRLLQQGQHALADQLLRQWQRESHRYAKIALLQAASYYGQGQPELALRELRGVAGETSEQTQRLMELFSQILQMQMGGVIPGSEANPWQVEFVGPSGKYEPSSLAETERAKLPENIVDTMGRLLALSPTSGNLWALYGELLNASGDPALALQAFDRAKILQYYPRSLRDRSRVLQEHQRELQRKLEEQFAQQADAAAADDSPESQSETNGVRRLGSRTQLIVVAVIGATIVVVLLILQVREWRKGLKAKSKR